MSKNLSVVFGVFCAVFMTVQSQEPRRIDMWQFGGVDLTSITSQRESAIACGDRGVIVAAPISIDTWRRVVDSKAGDTTTLNRVEYVAPSIAIAVGTRGCIIRTTNHGDTWSRIASGTIEDLKAIAVTSDDRVICVGTGGVALVSRDQGLTWDRQIVPTDLTINDVSAISDGSVKAVGDSGLIGTLLPSSDTWSITVGTTSDTLLSCWFGDAQFGFASVTGMILKTEDGGYTWSEDNMTAPRTITRIQRAGSRLIGCGSTDGMVFVATLTSWHASFWMTESLTVRGAAIVPSAPDLIYVVGNSGLIRSFNLTKPLLNEVGAFRAPIYYDQVMSSDGSRLFVGTRGAIHQLRSNGSWVNYRQMDTAVIGVERIDPLKLVFVVTRDGRVEWRFDGDGTWYQATTPGTAPRAVRAFSCVADLWLVEGSRVLRGPGPNEWYEVHVEPGVELYDVENFIERKAAVCGSRGTVLYSINSGTTWTKSVTGVDVVLRGIDLNIDGNGYVVGDGGTILKTTNVGATFEPEDGPNSMADFTAVDVDPNTGLVVIVAADGSIFIRPTEASSWQYTRGFTHLRSVLIAGGAITAAGDGGTIYQIPLNAVSVDEAEIPRLVVAPNPASMEATVYTDIQPAGSRLELVSLTGQIITSISMPEGSAEVSLDFHSVASGLYVVQLLDRGGFLIGRAHVVK